jgi:hypothetical protein
MTKDDFSDHLNYLDSICNIGLVSYSHDYKCFIQDICQLLGIDNSGLELTELPSRLKDDIFDKIEGLIVFEKKVVKTTSDKFFDHLSYLRCIVKRERYRKQTLEQLSDHTTYLRRLDTIGLLKSLGNYKCFTHDICKLLGVENNDLNRHLSSELKDDIFDKIKVLKGVHDGSN